MKLLFGGTKGGSGKSTAVSNIAAYLAGEGVKTLVIDTDKQGTVARWIERRENTELNPVELPKIYCQQTTGNVYNAIEDAAKLYEVVIIDAGGYDSRELRTAMMAADKIYIPVQASQFDLETLVELNELITHALDKNNSLEVFGFLSRVPSNPLGNEVREARALMAEFPQIRLVESVISDRKIYRDVTPQGRGVVEAKNGRARAEIQLFAEEIFA